MEYKYIEYNHNAGGFVFKQDAFANENEALQECSDYLESVEENKLLSREAFNQTQEEMNVFYDWATSNGIRTKKENDMPYAWVADMKRIIRKKKNREMCVNSYMDSQGYTDFYSSYFDKDGKIVRVNYNSNCGNRGKNYMMAFNECAKHFAEQKLIAQTKERIVMLSIEYCHKMNLKFTSLEEACTLADNHSYNRLIETLEGKQIYQNVCDYCESFVIGDNRCGCGDTRLDLIIDGSFYAGYDYYVERY